MTGNELLKAFEEERDSTVELLRKLVEMESPTTDKPLVDELAFFLADHARDCDSARADIRAIVVAFSRQAFDRTFEGKSVRPELQEPLQALYANYAFEQHSMPGESANARLLAEEERAELEAFLFERFALVDVPEAAAERLLAMTEHTGIDRVFLCVEASDPLKLVRLACERMLPRLPL